MPKLIFHIRKKLRVFWFISIKLISKKKFFFINSFLDRLIYLLFTPTLSLSNFITFF